MNFNRDGLLKEFIQKKLWLAALPACETAIAKRLTEIAELQTLKLNIEKELNKNGHTPTEDPGSS